MNEAGYLIGDAISQLNDLYSVLGVALPSADVEVPVSNQKSKAHPDSVFDTMTEQLGTQIRDLQKITSAINQLRGKLGGSDGGDCPYEGSNRIGG